MANRMKGEAKFKIGETEYTLCFNNEALIQLEDVLDRGIVSIMKEMEKWTDDPDRVRLKWIRGMMWVALRKHHPQMTLENVGDMLFDGGKAGEALEAIGDAMKNAFGNDAETKDARPTNGASKNGTGDDSLSTTSAPGSTSDHSGSPHRSN